MDKEVSTLVRGYMYPSLQVSRCPRYHRCLLTSKCTSYDPHQPDCAMCETRVQPQRCLGGLIAEGKYHPDLQDAVHTLEQLKQRSMANRNDTGQTMETGEEVTDEMARIRKSIDMCKLFLNEGIWDMNAQTARHWYDPEKRKFMGRIK